MSDFILCVLMVAALAFQYWLDVRNITRVAHQNGWSVTRIVWTPWAPGAAWRSRLVRSYWLRYRDASGELERALCWVSTNLLDGPSGVTIEPAPEATVRAPRAPLSRGLRIVRAAAIGASLGLVLGIAGSLVIFPTSNIAPAYGILFVAPAGFVLGALVGFARA